MNQSQQQQLTMAAEHQEQRPVKRTKTIEQHPVRADANEVLVFHMASLGDDGQLCDVPGIEAFAPGMCHQVFGDDEMVCSRCALTQPVLHW